VSGCDHAELSAYFSGGFLWAHCPVCHRLWRVREVAMDHPFTLGRHGAQGEPATPIGGVADMKHRPSPPHMGAPPFVSDMRPLFFSRLHRHAPDQPVCAEPICLGPPPNRESVCESARESV